MRPIRVDPDIGITQRNRLCVCGQKVDPGELTRAQTAPVLQLPLADQKRVVEASIKDDRE
jgi:hypothetical protein